MAFFIKKESVRYNLTAPDGFSWRPDLLLKVLPDTTV
jgi:hypothetical protein